MLPFMGSQKVRDNLMTEQQQFKMQISLKNQLKIDHNRKNIKIKHKTLWKQENACVELDIYLYLYIFSKV